MASISLVPLPTDVSRGQASSSPDSRAATNLEVRSNIIVAGGNVNIVAGTVSQDPPLDVLKLAKWLSPVNSHQTHKDVSEKVMKGTGSWIFKDPKVIDWISNKTGIVWGTGMPGAGKTCLASIVINHLIDDKRTIVLYIYSQYKDQLSTADFLACLLRQAVLISDKVATHVSETLHKPCLSTDTRPSRSELLATLRGALQLLNGLYLVVDALDELGDDVRPELISDLTSLQQPLFMTSRPLSDLPHITEPNLAIRATDDDLHDFISSKVDTIPQLRRYLQGPGVREEIINKILEKCQGMFLLAALQIDVLASGGIIDRRSLREAIGKLPITLNDQYELTLKRIRMQSPAAQRLACCAIAMVTHTTRILEVSELLAALTVDTDAVDVDEERRTTTDTLVAVSCGLLAIEKESGTVQLIHHTAQKFLEGCEYPLADNPHRLIADVSAIYMCQPGIDYAQLDRLSDLQATSNSHPFFFYACWNLGYHTYQAACHCNDQTSPRVSELFRNRRTIPIPLDPLGDYVRIDHGQAIHFAALHGLASLFEDNQQTIDAKSSLGCSPLFFACLGGQSGLAERIMSLLGPTTDFGLPNQFGATVLHAASRSGEISLFKRFLPKWSQTNWLSTGRPVLGCLPIILDARMFNGQTALHLASYHGHTAAVEVLLSCNDMVAEAGWNMVLLDGSLNIARGDDTAIRWLLSSTRIDVNAEDNRGWSPLHLAAMNGHRAVVRLLLTAINIEVNTKDCYGRSPLRSAVEGGHEAIVQLLLAVGNVNVNWGWSSLHPAVKNGDVEMVRLLLSSPTIDINAKDDRGRGSLHLAAMDGHEAVVQLLLDSPNIDVNAKDQYKSSPLHLVASNGHTEVVRLLLGYAHIDVNAQDDDGRSPLHSAARNGHEGVVRLLLDSANIDVNATDEDGTTPLYLAVENDHKAVVQLLINSPNIDVNAKTKDGRSSLHLAAKNRHNAVIQLLLNSANIDINVKDRSQETPLHSAAANGHAGVVRLLLDSPHIDVNAEGGYGSRPLHEAAVNGHEGVVRLLLDSPHINVNVKDEGGWSPLHSAAYNGQETVVRLLLDSPHIDVNAKDGSGSSVLHSAVENGHMEVVRLLLDSPHIDVNAQDEDGRSPLYLAAENGHEAVVRLLLDSPNIDVNAKDEEEWSPLHNAAYFGRETVVRLLLGRSGIETRVKAPSRWYGTPSGTPLELARLRRHQHIVALFEGMGFGDSQG